MRESALYKQIQMAVTAIGHRLFRNNVGTLKNQRGEYVTYGLCEGSSDLIGWKTIRIQPWHIGMNIAQFVAIEVKMPGKKATEKQQNFIEAVKQAGGIATVCCSTEEALNAIQR